MPASYLFAITNLQIYTPALLFFVLIYIAIKSKEGHNTFI